MPKRGIAAGERDARTEYPVQPGETWAVGPHRFYCGDLEADAGKVVLELAGGHIDVVWTDPPWGGPQARMYRTIAEVDGRQGRVVEWPEFLRAAVTAWSVCAGDVWVQSGLREEQDFVEAVEGAGGALLGSVPLTWPHPCCMLLFRFAGLGRPIPTLPYRERSQTAARASLTASRAAGSSGVVADFCMGLGYAPKAAAALGFRFAGSELSPGRMAMAMRKTAQVVGEAARRL